MRSFANMNPLISGTNYFYGLKTGKNIYGQEMDHDAMSFALFGAVIPGGAEGEVAAEGAGWLSHHEGLLLGHTIDRHVGKTAAELMSRLSSSARISASSTFINQATAESVIATTIRQNRSVIKLWLRNGDKARLVLGYEGNSIIGSGIRRGQSAVSSLTNAQVVLKSNGRGGYFILTSYAK